MTGDPLYVVLVERDHPVRVYGWEYWCSRPFSERPANAYVIPAKDEIDAYLKAIRGELPNP